MMHYNPMKAYERRSDTEIYNVLSNAHTLSDDDKEQYEVEWGLSFDEEKNSFSPLKFEKNTPGSILFVSIGFSVIACHIFGVSALAIAIKILIFLAKALMFGAAVVGTAKVSQKVGQQLIIKINGKVIEDTKEE